MELQLLLLLREMEVLNPLAPSLLSLTLLAIYEFPQPQMKWEHHFRSLKLLKIHPQLLFHIPVDSN